MSWRSTPIKPPPEQPSRQVLRAQLRQIEKLNRSADKLLARKPRRRRARA